MSDCVVLSCFAAAIARQNLETVAISTVIKSKLATQLDGLTKQILAEKKAQLAVRVEQQLDAVKQVTYFIY